jgi:hypothetical protein
MDTVFPVRRSEMVSHIRAKGTKPKLIVRGLAHRPAYHHHSLISSRISLRTKIVESIST